MTPSDQEGRSNIGLDYLTGVYSETTVETRDPQPIFIIPRDTIRTFLHEKVGSLALHAKILGLVGVEMTLLATLLTADFKDRWIVKSHVICGLFIAFSLIVAYAIVVNGISWIKFWGALTVDRLADELGSRGSEIKPRKNEELATLREQ